MTQKHQICVRSRRAVYLRFTANLQSCRIIALLSRKEVFSHYFRLSFLCCNHLNVIVIYVLYVSKLYQICHFNFPVQLQCFGRKEKKIKSLSIEKRKGCYLGTEELPQKAVRVIHAVHSSVTAGDNTEYFLEWCRESIG